MAIFSKKFNFNRLLFATLAITAIFLAFIFFNIHPSKKEPYLLSGANSIAEKYEEQKFAPSLGSEVSPAPVREMKSRSVMIRKDLVRGNATSDSSKKNESSSAMPPLLAQADPSPRALFKDSNDDGPFITSYVGYGSRYVQIKQTGDFGSGEGAGLSRTWKVGAIVKYDRWFFMASSQDSSVNLSRSTTDSSSRDKRDFKNLSFVTGYDLFSTGLNFESRPVFKVNGSSIEWGDMISTSLVLGFHRDSENSQNKVSTQFDLGVSYLLGSTGNGPTIDSASGFGLVTKFGLAKSFLRRQGYNLSCGVEFASRYEFVKFNGSWGTFKGDSKRTLIEANSLIYLGLKF